MRSNPLGSLLLGQEREQDLGTATMTSLQPQSLIAQFSQQQQTRDNVSQFVRAFWVD